MTRGAAAPRTPATVGSPSGRGIRAAPVLAAALLAGAASLAGVPAPPQAGTVAFVGVAVVPMDREAVVPDQTVVVRDGRIVEMGPAGEVAVPEGATRVDGRGAYLIPGLAEMHGHLPGGAVPAQVAEDILFLYVANGVTTVRGMQGHPSQFALRQRVERGEIVGPRLVLGSPAMSGRSVPDVETARRLVQEYKAAGYDLLKVHEGLGRPVYDAIVATAREAGVPLGGHVSDEVGLLYALEAGQGTIDHLDNYVEALVPEEARREAPPLFGVTGIVDQADEARIPELVEATRRAGAYVVPTMVLWEVFLGGRGPEELRRERPEVRYMPRRMVERWERSQRARLEALDRAAGERVMALRRRLLRALHDGGAGILFGTDSPQVFSVPGFSIHREMALWVEVGMSPYEVLRTATWNVAAYLGNLDEAGSVAVGKRADLVLLDANPLEDVAAVARRRGVMVAGRWLPEAEIAARLEAIAARYGAGP